MYSASREFHEPDVPPEILLEVVYDVEAYPDFVKGINGVTVKNRGPNNIVAEFDADMGAMKFRYTLLIEREAGVVRWRRLAGAFRANEGSMVHLGDGHYRYKNAMDPGFAVPGFAVRFVLERSLPRLIKELRARAHERVTGS
ncbi:MAG: SRPBCC family protein [Planctomycetes bacterium]|nr:SRPBCC family protein [Planctomycetota bacterium]